MEMHDHSQHHHSEAQHSHADHSAAQDHSGHGSHHNHQAMIGDFKRRLLISTILTIPVLLLSHMIQQILNFEFSFAGDRYVLFGFSTFIFFYGGWPFLTGLVTEFKKKNPGMMTLIAVAITAAYVYSSAVAFGLKGMDFFWELATLIDVMLLGHWIEMKSVSGASRAMEMLVKLLPAKAHLFHGDHFMDVNVEELKTGDIVLVKPGEKIPADGEITEGESEINESMLTGESKPVHRKTGGQVIGGSVNGNSSIRVKISRTGHESYLSRVVKLVEEAQKTKSQTQKFADKAAFWLTIFALCGGITTLIVWILLGKDFSFALERMVTVMVISCPHALGLAIPLVIAISTSLSARKGLLIRNRNAFENARKITTVIFDKTGTLTEGNFSVTRFGSFSTDLSKDEILKIALALEAHSSHPIALGIVREGSKIFTVAQAVTEFTDLPGKGVRGKIEGVEYMLAALNYLKENNIQLPADFRLEKDETLTVLMGGGKPLGFIALADKIRPESKKAVELLRRYNIKTLMLSGDNENVAKTVSEKLGLDGYFAGVLPEQKQLKIKELQAKGEFVAMTGDGVNDAPALAQADIGIAVGSGTDVAAETADIILVKSNPLDIASLIIFGRATYKKMLQNLIWATAYNAVTVPLATGFISGLVITPAAGALFMSLSTIIVAVNAQTLKRLLR